MKYRNQGRHIIFIAAVFLTISVICFAVPQRASAATPTVKIGGVTLYADGVEHTWRDNYPAITGWNGGSYKLSTDGKTLVLNGFKYSGNNAGITSTDSLNIVFNSTCTFTVPNLNDWKGINLVDQSGNHKDLTLTGRTDDSTLTINSDAAWSVLVNKFSLSSDSKGTVDIKGTLFCDSSFMVGGGNLKVSGSVICYGESVISGGEANIPETLIVYDAKDGSTGMFRQTGGRLLTGKLWLQKAVISGGYILANSEITLNHDMTLSGGTVISRGNIELFNGDYVNGLTGTGGTLIAMKNLYIYKDALINGSSVIAQSDGVHITGDLTVNKGSLTGINTSSEAGHTGILVEGNTTIDGTAKVSATTENGRSFYTKGTLTINGGTVNATNNASPLSDNTAYSNLRANNLIVTGGTVTAIADGTAGRALDIDSTLHISGGTVSGTTVAASSIWVAVYSKDSITASGGKLTGTTGSSVSGLYTSGGINVSGTADISGTSNTGSGVYAAGTIDVKGGSLTGTSSSGSGVYAAGTIDVKGGKLSGNSDGRGISADTIKTSGGEINAISTGSNGIFVKKLEVFGGTVYGESGTTRPFSGVHISDSFKMTGGKVTGKVSADVPSPVYAPLAGTELADNIWMSEPADGYNTFHGAHNTIFLYEYAHDMHYTKTATFQAVTGISVKTEPSALLYKGDFFDPDGLVLNLTFADGTISDLSYDTYHKDMFSFSLSQSQPLNVGTQTVRVDCLTHSNQFSITVRDLGVPVLSGRANGHIHELEWTQADGAEIYYLYGRKEGESSYRLLTSGNIKQYKNYDALPGETWEYYVNTSRRATSGTEVTGSDSKHLTLTSTLDSPRIYITESSFDSVDIKWGKVTGATGYEVYRSEAGGSFEKIGYVTEDDFSETGLITGREYKYYIKAAIPEKDIYSDQSNTLTLTPEFTEVTVLELSGDGVNELIWEAIDGATGYEVMRGDGKDGKRTLLATVDAETTSFADDTIDVYAVYNYAVVPIRTVEDTTFRGKDSNVVVSNAKDKPAPEIAPPTKDDPAGTVFNLLQARAGKITMTSVQIVWKKVPGAKKYVVYGNKCGTKNKYKKLTETTKTTLTYKKVAGKKVRKGTYYKFLVYALDADGKVISTSKTVHVATTGGKVGNDKKVTTAAKKGKVTVKKGQTFKLKAKAVPASKKLKVHRHRKIAYESSNKKIATVSSKGVIKGKSKGTCYVYAYTQNGVYKRIKVTVK